MDVCCIPLNSTVRFAVESECKSSTPQALWICNCTFSLQRLSKHFLNGSNGNVRNLSVKKKEKLYDFQLYIPSRIECLEDFHLIPSGDKVHATSSEWYEGLPSLFKRSPCNLQIYCFSARCWPLFACCVDDGVMETIEPRSFQDFIAVRSALLWMLAWSVF